MVLLEGGFLLSTGVSIIMIGACCIYTMNEEKELREAMRQDIRAEWKFQRELENRERRQQEMEADRLRILALEKRYHRKILALSSSTVVQGTIGTCEDSRKAFSSSSLTAQDCYPRNFPTNSLFDEDEDEFNEPELLSSWNPQDDSSMQVVS